MPGRSGRDDRQGVKSYGAPLGPAAPADNPSPRNVARPASDAQVHQALQDNDGAVRRASTPAPAASSPGPSSDPATKDLSINTAAGRIAGGVPRIDKAIEDAGG